MAALKHKPHFFGIHISQYAFFTLFLGNFFLSDFNGRKKVSSTMYNALGIPRRCFSVAVLGIPTKLSES